jgi:TolB-like protein/Tfp pilus assembly protein PilF
MHLLSELRRRRVIRVAGLYAVAAWVATEVSATVLPLLQVPEKYVTTIVIGLIALFPVVMVLAWIYDIGPTGIKKTPEPETDNKTAGRPGMLFHVLLLLLVMLVFGYALFYFGQTRALQSVPRSSIAVLPFDNLSNDADKDYFSDGMSEEILNLLSRVEGLNVAARTSSFALRDSNDDIPTIGRKLGVETVLEGSVRWAGDSNQIRVTAQLIDAASGYHLWSENFDRDLKDIFSVQSEIAMAIVDKLRISLGTDTAGWVAPTVDAEAYDLYLRGRQLLNARRVAQIRESIDFFQRAVARDPSFAPALAAMAVAYVSLPIFSDEPVEQLHTMAEEAVQRVLILSPENAEALAVRAWLAQYKGEWRRAEFGYFAATSMDPYDVTTRVWYSGFLLIAGKLEQGQVQAERALELDPDNPLTRAAAATAAMVRGENETCTENAAAARELGFSSFVNNLEGICLARLGRLDDASEALKMALGPMQEDNALASLAAALPGSTSLQDAAASAMTDADLWQNDPWAMWLAAAAGEPERAFARIIEGFVDGGYLHAQLLWTPETAVLRRDPRFLEIMRVSGIARIWRNDPPDLCNSESGGTFSCY